MSNEFHVTLLSNADTGIYDNKLSSFRNNLPHPLDFKPSNKWMVCIKSLGFSTEFYNVAVKCGAPEDAKFPSLIFYRLAGGAISDLSNGAIPVHLDKSIMSIAEINDRFKAVSKLIPEVEVKIVAGQRPAIRYVELNPKTENLNRNSVLVLIHETARKTFEFPINQFRESLEVSGTNYFVFRMSEKRHVLIGSHDQWYYKYPEVVQVGCSEIKEKIYNSGFDKYLSVICPNFKPGDRYFTHTFDVEEYCELSNNFLTSLSISLRDGNSQLLNLLPGPATFVKLKFRKMRDKNFFNVRLSSEKSEFETELPHPIDLDSSWKISLTSICYPPELHGIPVEKNQRTLFVSNILYPQQDKTSFVIPASVITLEQLVEEIDIFFGLNLCRLDRTGDGSYLEFLVAPNLKFELPVIIMELLG